MKTYDLSVMMPIYNEQECIIAVIESWVKVLSVLNIKYLIIALNDGSTDDTKNKLATLENNENIQVINKENSGHGPTILMGYRKAVELSTWVFQCDSDNEMKAEHFPKLWHQHKDYDAVFGARWGRSQTFIRKLMSIGSRITVRVLFGNRVKDVNTAYRLMKSCILKQIIARIPENCFAPNVIISGAFDRAGCRINSVPIPFEPRETGKVSISGIWGPLKISFKCFWQILKYRITSDSKLNVTDEKD
jgi:dolichol-phosphate mannosyltransferase